MFATGHWAAAFINSLEKEGGEIEDGIEILKVLASWVKSLPGTVSGSAAAKRLEALVRKGMANTNASGESEFFSPARETTVRFFILMIKKNMIRYIDSVIDETKKLLDKKRGVITISIEHTLPLGDSFTSGIKEVIKKRTGAVRVDLTGRINPELIGGYRLRIGDEIIDASIRSQLRNLETCLADGITGPDGGN